MRREDIRELRRGEIVHMECQIQRYRARNTPKSTPWTTWQTNFQLSAVSRLYTPASRDVPLEPESEEEALVRVDSDDDDVVEF